MKTEVSYTSTMVAGYGAYLSQSIVNNFAPLLFVWFGAHYGIPLDQISLLIIFNFGVQIGADLLAAVIADRIGYRRGIILSHALAAIGTASLAILPPLLPDPFLGLLIAVSFSAFGSGGIEVLVSPMIDACPGKHKSGVMALLHSFYAWGFLLVTLVSTLFFVLVGIENWPILAVLWALLITANGISFFFVPMVENTAAREEGVAASVKRLLRTPLFYLLFFLMLASGASEMVASQWGSAFLEMTVGLKKAVGDLLGPCLFALFMGLARINYALGKHRISLRGVMLASSILAFLAYLLIGIASLPLLLLLSFALAGFAVGILWPGTYSLAGKYIPLGGTPMFSLLAFAGDLGCAVGPALAGVVAEANGNDLRLGMLAALIFPAMLIVGNLILLAARKQKNDRKGEPA